MKRITFRLRPVAPFRLDLTVWVLRRRADNLWDRWDGKTYRRVLVLQGRALEIAVTQSGPSDRPELTITATGLENIAEKQSIIAATIERVMGLQVDLKEFYAFVEQDSILNPLVQKFRGLKPPRFPTAYEALVNAITCQQFTLTAGIRMLNRLVTNWGAALEGQENSAKAFPGPADLAELKGEVLRDLGFSRQKAQALIELSRLSVNEVFDPEALTSLSDEQALEHLQRLRGVGRWTAEYTLLRGLGRVHIFPADDVGVRNNLQRWLNVGKPLDYESAYRIVSRWKPYGGLIYFHLLLNNLAM